MVDPITLEVLRCKLEAIAEDGARTTIRTAISPVVAEAGDCSCTIYSATGDVIMGGGSVQIHFHAGRNGIDTILRLHGDKIAAGDIFLVNDPYNGGGLHANDVFIHIPVFHENRLIAWVGASAHMIDMGGSVPGSFSMSATECYQEAFRMPPVRLSRAGVEQEEIWAIVRNNVRLSNIVEMDMRSLISGANVVATQLLKLIGDYGAETFVAATAALADLTESEVRKRILQLEPGEYKAATWCEWTDELYYIPCVLTVKGDRLSFDFSDASPQSQHYNNSKAYVVRSLLGVALLPYLARDLPFNEGVFRCFDVVCRPGSILDAQAPAPIGGPHLEVGQATREVAISAFNLAVSASDECFAHGTLAGPSASSGMALATFGGIGLSGDPDGWLMLEGALVGASAGHDRDATDMAYEVVGTGAVLEMVDVEVMESWYPLRFEYRKLRSGPVGGGTHSAGRGASLAYTIAGTPELKMTVMANRERVPIRGNAGGLPGGLVGVRLRRDGVEENLVCHQDNLNVFEGDTLIFDASGGGGWGDPLGRNPVLVNDDVRRGLLTAQEALENFGVVPGDEKATQKARARLRKERLSRAEAAPHPLKWTAELRAAAEGVRAPLAPGVAQQGRVAVSEASGAPLAVSPGPWIDGCPRIHNFVATPSETDVTAYLDPETGDLLIVDVAPTGAACSFSSMPRRWVQPSAATSIAAE